MTSSNELGIEMPLVKRGSPYGEILLLFCSHAQLYC